MSNQKPTPDEVLKRWDDPRSAWEPEHYSRSRTCELAEALREALEAIDRLQEELRKSANEVEQLREAILSYIALDRMIDGKVPEDRLRELTLFEGESVSSADFLRVLGVPVGDYP